MKFGQLIEYDMRNIFKRYIWEGFEPTTTESRPDCLIDAIELSSQFGYS